jgi:hypothetical protein
MTKAALTLAVACLCFTATTRAHEMGSSRALLTLRADGTFRLEIVVDPQNLLAQLAIRTGDRVVAVAADQREAQLRAQLRRVAEGIELYFDDRQVTAPMELHRGVNELLARGLTAGVGDAVTLSFAGKVPPMARRLSLAYRWSYGAMPLLVKDQPAAEPRVVWLGAGERSPELPIAGADRPAVVRQYIQLGFTHIVPLGIDHILFVLGLFFLSAGWRALLLQVSTFTMAHTVTLGLTMLGVVSISPSIVEPLIALSIAYVAIENLTTRELKRSRLALIFCFGLLHGMGFAGVLSELGLPSSGFFEALLSFNAGVELGQLAVLLAATTAVAGWRRRDGSLLPLVARPASGLIAVSGLYWTIERIFQ